MTDRKQKVAETEQPGLLPEQDQGGQKDSGKDKEQGDKGPISPEVDSNVFNRWTMWWLNDLFWVGFRRQIQEQDLYQIFEHRRARVLGQMFFDNWEAEKSRARDKKRAPSLLRAIVRSFWVKYLPGYICLELGDICQISAPLILEKLLRFVQESQASENRPSAGRGYGLAIAVFVVAFLQILVYGRWNLGSITTGLYLRTALIDVVFRKATTLSAKAHLLYPDGTIINIMSTDISRIDRAMIPLLIAVASPLYVFVIVGLLVNLMGPAALLGAAILMLSNPIQAWGLSRLAPVRKSASECTDSRIRLSTEILQGIRVIKFFAWENSFLAKLAEIRALELALIRRILTTRGFITATSSAIPVFASAISLALYAALGHEVKPEVVFPALAYYAIMRIPLLILPDCYTTSVDAYVAIKRIEKFLLSDDGATLPRLDESADAAITFENADFVWESGSTPTEEHLNDHSNALTDTMPTLVESQEVITNSNGHEEDDNGQKRTRPYLHNINLKVKHGSLVAVVGPVGSGKSSLLQAMVGNMTLTGGKVSHGATISYASQTPWIQNSSVRDNILFDKPFEEDRYWQVVKACCLEQDLASFHDYDLTEIGERGVNLSGGQKARLSLARSVYFNAGMVVMDDPLSAVDAHVGKRLWEDCVLNELKGRTRIIATHQLHVLPDVDYIICMKNGIITEEGTYQDLMAMEGEFSFLMSKHGGADSGTEEAGATRVSGDQSSSTDQRQDSSTKDHNQNGDLDDLETQGADPQTAAQSKGASKLMAEEEREQGAVSFKVYGSYFSTVSAGLWALVVFCYVTQQVCGVMMNYWLSLWSDKALDLSMAACIGVYVSFAVAQFIVGVTASYSLSRTVVRTTREMHSQAFDKVIHAPLSFFDTTPMGRIQTLNDIMFTGLTVLGSVALMVIFFPYLLFAIVPMAGLYYGLSIYYRSTSREVKRLDSTLRSVLYAYFSESLTGMGTLKAYNRIEHAIKVNQQKLDRSNRPYYLFQIGTRWIAFRVQAMGTLLIFMAAMFVVGTRTTINAATAGLVLSYLARTAGDLNYFAQCIANLENNMNSAERLVHYVKNLPQEPATESRPDHKPPSTWPAQGQIEFQQVTMRYRPELAPVLRDISFSIQAGHNIGVVGRTGAGKSSLIQALFLLCELDSGKILIDGINTLDIGTADLRSHIGIIPQDPVLFQGTFRYNLDPLERHTEQELWQVLETSDLKTYVQAQD
ncbi:hypothetical protein BGX28_009529, partial [Mortierella sp. GBA30]